MKHFFFFWGHPQKQVVFRFSCLQGTFLQNISTDTVTRTHLCSRCSRCVSAGSVCRVCLVSVCSAAGDGGDSAERRSEECNTPSAAQTHGTHTPACGTRHTLSPAQTHTLRSSAAELREPGESQTHSTVNNMTDNTHIHRHTHRITFSSCALFSSRSPVCCISPLTSVLHRPSLKHITNTFKILFWVPQKKESQVCNDMTL